jgi:hypothetical protein
VLRSYKSVDAQILAAIHSPHRNLTQQAAIRANSHHLTHESVYKLHTKNLNQPGPSGVLIARDND